MGVAGKGQGEGPCGDGLCQYQYPRCDIESSFTSFPLEENWIKGLVGGVSVLFLIIVRVNL
jgi:hypothetical protein